jgi:VPDSG-CTERM motif
MLELIIAVVIGPKPAVQVPDLGTTLSLLTFSLGAIAFVRAKWK